MSLYAHVGLTPLQAIMAAPTLVQVCKSLAGVEGESETIKLCGANWAVYFVNHHVGAEEVHRLLEGLMKAGASDSGLCMVIVSRQEVPYTSIAVGMAPGGNRVDYWRFVQCLLRMTGGMVPVGQTTHTIDLGHLTTHDMQDFAEWAARICSCGTPHYLDDVVESATGTKE